MDPPTKGVPLRQLLRLQLDAAASGVAVHFCGNSQVHITVHSTLVNGSTQICGLHAFESQSTLTTLTQHPKLSGAFRSRWPALMT